MWVRPLSGNQEVSAYGDGSQGDHGMTTPTMKLYLKVIKSTMHNTQLNCLLINVNNCFLFLIHQEK